MPKGTCSSSMGLIVAGADGCDGGVEGGVVEVPAVGVRDGCFSVEVLRGVGSDGGLGD